VVSLAATTALTATAGLAGEDDANDEAVQSERLGKDEDEDHADEELWLLRVSPNASVADNADGHARGQATEATGKACRQVGIAVEEVVLGANCGGKGATTLAQMRAKA